MDLIIWSRQPQAMCLIESAAQSMQLNYLIQGDAAACIMAALQADAPLLAIAGHPDAAETLNFCRELRSVQNKSKSGLLLITHPCAQSELNTLIEVGIDDIVFEGIPPELLICRLTLLNNKSVRSRFAEPSPDDERQRQLQRLEAIGRLAGGIAHDFNNLLMVILGRCELLEDDAQIPAYAVESIREIQRTSERASNLTRQLLAFSRQQILQPKVINLNHIVNDTQLMLSRMIGEDIQMQFKLSADLGQVRADPGQLEQVLVNLTINARDAMPEGGRIWFETQNVELDAAYAKTHAGVIPGRHVLLAVTDNGCGMDQATSRRIFEPFFTTKKVGKGTGLGLATAYGIVKQSGGNIWCYSELGHGTTFKIYLPRVDQPLHQEIRQEQPAPAVTGKENVLVVDDDDSVRNLVADILRCRGFNVLDAASGKEALLLFNTSAVPIDLLLTDVVMPGMNGRELADRIAPLAPEMKVIFMSGYTNNSVSDQGILKPGSPFIQKPFAASCLINMVTRMLEIKPVQAGP